jgi:hypothetical protein
VTDGEQTLHLTVRVRDMDRTRLFVHELMMLRDDMRVGASPFAERIERTLDRYVDGGDDEGDGVIADEATIEHVETIEDPCPRCGYPGDAP